MKVSPLALTLVLIAGSPVAAADQVPAAAAVHVPFIEGKPFAEVLKRARAEKKPVLLDVVAAWCGPCKMMDRTTFADPAVVDWAKKNVLSARVDAEKGEGRKLSARFAVRSFPTIIFLDPDGSEIDRLLGAFGPPDFKANAEKIVAKKSRLYESLDKLSQAWTPELAAGLVRALADRNDLKRVRPMAIRLITEDPDLTHPETLDSLALLAALEDLAEKLTPETADLVATYIPRLGEDPRRGVLSVILAREQGRRGDVAGARATVAQATKMLGESSTYTTDLLAAVGSAEKKAGQFDAAVATYKKAVAVAEKAGTPALLAYLQMNLAEALASAGKEADARAALAASLARAGEETAALTRAARISLLLKAPKEAVVQARKAVGLSLGEDAEAQAALGAALSATGDASGAAEAWRRAGEIDPENAEIKQHLRGKKPGAAKPS